MRSVILISLFSTSIWALDIVAVQETSKELDSSDPKVRAAAVEVLVPLIPELGEAIKKNKELISVLQKVESARDKFIAENDAYAAACCIAYYHAQEIFHRTDYDKDGVLEYAQSIAGDESLCESKKGMSDRMLLDIQFQAAEWGQEKAVPKSGYYFKVLKRKGPSVRSKVASKDGQRDYVVNGNMTSGFALVAFPAEYGVIRKNSFMIDDSRTVYKRDIGLDTKVFAEKMTEFDPGTEWQKVQ